MRVTRRTGRPGAARPREQFAAAVGATAAQLVGASGAEGAFIAADAGVAVQRQRRVAAFAGGPHVKHLLVSSWWQRRWRKQDPAAGVPRPSADPGRRARCENEPATNNQKG